MQYISPTHRDSEIVAKPGFVYLLQNDSHDQNVVKIGLTIRSPDLRRKEIYQGATGVPEHFDIAVAFSVGNCAVAEKLIHSRLQRYRVNPKREFFRIPADIAAAIAFESCVAVNNELGLDKPETLNFEPVKPKEYLKKVSDPFNLENKPHNVKEVNISDLKMSPVGTSQLSPSQIDRIRIIHAIFRSVDDSSLTETIESFSRDLVPEPDIEAWENMARVFMEIDPTAGYTEVQQREAFSLIFRRSIYPESEMGRFTSNGILSAKAVEFILKRYRGE